jgi:hypothetical protein
MAKSQVKPAPEKIDLTKVFKNEYAAPRKPVLIETQPALYLSINGRGAPGGDDFQDRIGALYSMAFTIKMTRKYEGREDYSVCKLEARYWCDEMGNDFSALPRTDWRWTLMIRTPEFVVPADLEKASAALQKRGKSPLAREVTLERVEENRCVQMLHVGPYEREKETVDQMVAFAASRGLSPRGRHHEIYLSDPRRVPAERLKTILRLPVG